MAGTAANYHYISVTPAGGSETLLHTAGDGGASVITAAKLNNPLDIADTKVSANVVTNLPVPIRIVQGEDISLEMTLLNTPAVNAILRTWKGKVLAVKYRESVAAIDDPDNPEIQFNGLSNIGFQMGGSVGGGVTTTDVTISVCDGVAAIIDVTP